MASFRCHFKYTSWSHWTEKSKNVPHKKQLLTVLKRKVNLHWGHYCWLGWGNCFSPAHGPGHILKKHSWKQNPTDIWIFSPLVWTPMQTRIHYLHMHHICIQVATWKNLDQAFWDNDGIIFFYHLMYCFSYCGQGNPMAFV